MKKFLFLLIPAIIFACQDSKVTPLENEVSNQLSNATGSCNKVEYNLLAGQNIDVGNITISNSPDAKTVYVTYNTDVSGWYLGTMHLFVGDCADVPKNKQGVPVPGQFPLKVTPADGTTTYTFTVDISTLPAGACLCVYAHAEVKKIVDGVVQQSETAWGGNLNGDVNRWYYYANYCPIPCIDEPEGDLCSLSQGYWFAKPRLVWPSPGSVTIGGNTYTQAEGKALWKMTGFGKSDAAQCFFQTSAIYLSGTDYAKDDGLAAAVASCEACLSTAKLTKDNFYTYGVECDGSGDWIGGWIDANHCNK